MLCALAADPGKPQHAFAMQVLIGPRRKGDASVPESGPILDSDLPATQSTLLHQGAGHFVEI